MTTELDVVNRALQEIGTRSNVTQAELDNQTSNEAIQANLVLTKVRDELLRMAPWNCGTNTDGLTYITSAPGTPENTASNLTMWQKGIPAPPWAYEYQYPSDCLKPLWIVPQYSTGFSGGVPITTAVTGGAASFWSGPPVRFKVGVDQFNYATLATVVAPGTGHAVGDIVSIGSANPGEIIGAPARVSVTAVNGTGGITGILLLPNTNTFQTLTASSLVSGSYLPFGFSQLTNPVAQGVTTGSGVGATFNLTLALGDQRVILTNEEFAIMSYVRRVTNPDVMDEQFVQAWVCALSARLSFALQGDKQIANIKTQETNNHIMEARKADANEGLTVSNVTPDWIRMRGIAYPLDFGWAPNQTFDWGPVFSMY